MEVGQFKVEVSYFHAAPSIFRHSCRQHGNANSLHMERGMKWIHLGLLLATSGLCLLTSFCLAGMFGGPTDTFNHLWPVWMAYAIGLLVATLSIRALPLSAATSICITLLAVMAIDTRELPVAEAERDVRILSQNLWGSVTAAEGVVSLVRTTAPDIIALQEVYNHQNPALDGLASDYPYFIRCRWASTSMASPFWRARSMRSARFARTKPTQSRR